MVIQNNTTRKDCYFKLIISKQLLRQAKTKENMIGPYRATIILDLHDAVDIACSALGKKGMMKNKVREIIKDNKKLKPYHDVLDKLNEKRNPLKHSGYILPSEEIRYYISICEDFINELIIENFDETLNNIDMISFIEDIDIKNKISDIKKIYYSDDSLNTIEYISSAFKLIIEKTKILSLFNHGIYNSFIFERFEHDEFNIDHILDDLGDFSILARTEITKRYSFIINNISNIRIYLLLKELGIRRENYLKFSNITNIDLTFMQFDFSKRNDETEISKEDMNYCYDFLIDCALKVQEKEFI